MDKVVDINEFLDGEKIVPSTITVIDLSEFKNFNQIKVGLNIKCNKITLMTNPTGYQNFLNEVEKAANQDNIKLTYTESQEFFTVHFK